LILLEELLLFSQLAFYKALDFEIQGETEVIGYAEGDQVPEKSPMYCLSWVPASKAI